MLHFTRPLGGRGQVMLKSNDILRKETPLKVCASYLVCQRACSASRGYRVGGATLPVSCGASVSVNANDCDGSPWLQVVPTIYTDIRGRKIHSNQFL
ncbi:hypothetical protein ZWY2020_032181 [Hordeum vulgare]|nr:hypothetical protein ZWY2020_032181 [Hordeum vulgare]